MTQVNATQEQAHLTILREIVGSIARNTDPVENLHFVLESAKALTGASGSAVLIFDDPRLLTSVELDEAQFPGDEALNQWLGELGEGIHIDPLLPDSVAHLSPHVITSAIIVKDVVVGMFVLCFDDTILLEQAELSALESVIDCVTIVVGNIRVITRHKKLSRNQSEFMRIVSHDLRSPLTSMKGFASMLESGMVGEFNDQQAHFVDKILAGISQMTTLVDNFQDAGRYDPETGFYEMERSPCDVSDIVRRIVETHLVPAEKQELSVTMDTADNVPVINADINMLERAITNLVDNAIKYTPNGGVIEVGVRVADGEQLLVSVKDTGYGISPENQKMLFERHVRIARKEHKRVKGSGLGLFIVRSIAQRHGGDAWVVSEEGQGSTFFIGIPLDEQNTLLTGQ